MLNEKYVTIQGQCIWTEMLGPSTGACVLLIAGAGAHAHFWSDSFCASFIEHGFCIIRYDHRDVGLSDPGSETYDLMRLAQDALEILDAYHIQKAHIIGHSMGGYIAQLLSAEYPERVLSITLISSGPVGETEALTKAHTAQEREILHATWHAMLQNKPTREFQESLSGYMGVWKRLNGLCTIDEPLAHKYTEEIFTRSKYPPGVAEKHIKVMQKMASTLKERKEIFAKIIQPVLVLHGAEDYLVPPARGGQALATALPHAHFELIAKMGHMFFNYALEKLVADKVINFLLSTQLIT